MSNCQQPSTNPRMPRQQYHNRRRRRAQHLERVNLFREPGDQVVTFKDAINMPNLVNGEGKSGSYFKCYYTHSPYAALAQSSYAGLTNVYELWRIRSIIIQVMVPGATYNVGGLSASKMYRDGRFDNQNPFYEGLIQERLVKKGKLWKNYRFKWFPIETSDFDFIPINNTSDSGRFGQTNYAAASAPIPFNNAYTPFIEVTYTVEFKYLKDPRVPTSLSTPYEDDNDMEFVEKEINKMVFNNPTRPRSVGTVTRRQ